MQTTDNHDALNLLLSKCQAARALLAVLKWHFDPDQPRDSHGRWTAGDGADDRDQGDPGGRRGGPQANRNPSPYQRIGDWLKNNLNNLFPPPTTGSDPTGQIAYWGTFGQGGAPMHAPQTRLSLLWEQGVNNLSLTPAQRSARLTELATYMYDLALAENNPHATVATPSGDVVRPEIPAWLARYVGPAVSPTSNEGRQLGFFRQNIDTIRQAIRDNPLTLNRTNWIRVIREAVRHVNVNARLVGRRNPQAPDPDAR
jgi:hypothetical protein